MSYQRLALMVTSVLLLLCDPSRLAGQELRGVVRDSATRSVVPGAVVTVLDATDIVVGRNITNQRGEYRIALPPGARRARVVRLGFRPRIVAIPTTVGGASQIDVILTAIPVTPETVRTLAASNCPRRPDGAAALALLEQARNGLLATVVSRSVAPAHMKRLLYDRHMDGNSDRIVRQMVRIDSAVTTGSFGAVRSASDFVQQDFVQDSAGIRTFFAPDAETLLDDGFPSGYCFRIMEADRDRPRQIALGFGVADRRRGRIDIDGALWIDTTARALVDVEFRYVGLDRVYDAFHPGGQVSFQAMPNGTVLVHRWALRLVGSREDSVTVLMRRMETAQRPVARYYAQEVGGELARAVWDDGSSWKGRLGTLRMRLVDQDSLPAAGTVVNLSDSRYFATADSSGNIEIPDILPGPYEPFIVDKELAAVNTTIGTGLKFIAARDSLVQLRYRVPTAVDFALQLCTLENRPPGSALILARVTTPDGVPLARARWSVEQFVHVVGWVYDIKDRPTNEDGEFHYCHMGLGTLVRLTVSYPGAGDAAHVQMLTQHLTIVPMTLRPKQ
ncbi:MAG: carboxypeptidase regulatory-like domain-containing protein [bacterium]